MTKAKRSAAARRLEEAVERYFAGISQNRVLLEKGQPLQNDLGEAVVTCHYYEPPSLAGLCLHLGVSRRTWDRWCTDPALSEVTALAQLRIEAYLERQLLEREKNHQAVLFLLQNRCGASANGPESEQSIVRDMSLSEKLDAITRAAQTLQAVAAAENGGATGSGEGG